MEDETESVGGGDAERAGRRVLPPQNSVIPKLFLQDLPCTKDAGFDRADGYLQYFADLLVRSLLAMPEEDRHAVTFG